MAEDITTSEFISKLSVNNLPDNPAAHGWKAAEIKKNFFGPIYEGLNRLLKEIQQIDPSAGSGVSIEGIETLLAAVEYNINACRNTKRYLLKLKLDVDSFGAHTFYIPTDEAFNTSIMPGLDGNDVFLLFEDKVIYTSDFKFGTAVSLKKDTYTGAWYAGVLELVDGKYVCTPFPTDVAVLEEELIDTKSANTGESENTSSGGSSGGGVESLPLTKLTSDSFTLQYISSGVYGARLLIYSNTPTCVSEINNYYYCTNFASLVSGISYVNVSLNNSYVHSKTNVYAGYNLATEHPIPTGQTMQWGKNNTGYYLRPNFLEYYEANYYYSGDCDWYVELELNINMQQLIIKAYQCERIYQYLD